MRLRNVKGSREAIQESIYVVHEEETRAGSWHDIFGNDHPIHIEIGMGKGRFLMELAAKNPDINYVGIEKYSSVLIRALDTACQYPFCANGRRSHHKGIRGRRGRPDLSEFLRSVAEGSPCQEKTDQQGVLCKIQCDPESRWQSGIQDGQPSPVRFLSGICGGGWLEAGCGNLRPSS